MMTILLIILSSCCWAAVADIMLMAAMAELG